MILAWDNLADAAAISTDSELTSLPSSNVQQPHLSRKWHTAAGVKSAYLLLDMGASVSCGVLAVLGSNLTSAATLRLRAHDVPDNYLLLPGTTGNFAKTPDSASNSITGDIDIRVKVSLDDWTPSAAKVLLSKLSAASQWSYDFYVGGGGSTGKLCFLTSPDGTANTSAISSVATGIADGAVKWVRATRVSATGVTKFYTSDDGVTWAQLGTDVSNTAGAIYDSTSEVRIGQDTGGPLAGKVYRAQVYNGIDGTLAVDFDATDAANGATSFVSSTSGETWTINQSGSPAAGIVGWLFDTGTVSAGAVAGYGAAYKSFTVAAARYWRLDLADATVASNLQIGRVFLGPKWTPSVNQEYGWSVTVLDPSDLDESYGGQEYADEKPQRRQVQFTLTWMNEAEMYGNAFALARANGRVRDVLAIHDIAGAYLSQQAVWGLIQANEPLIHERAQIYRQKFTLRERL